MKMPRQFRVLRNSEAADVDTVRVTLFRYELSVYAWYLGPISAGFIAEAASAHMIASRAIIRAIDLADRIGTNISIIDPDGLWPEAWGKG